MNNFLKENFVLILGLTLPMALIIVFIAAQSLTKPADPPQYSALFFDGDTSYTAKLDNTGKLGIRYTQKKRGHYNHNAKMRLYLFNPTENKTETFKIDPPENIKDGKTVTVKAPEALTKLLFDPTQESPDGYIFAERPRQNRSFFTEVFSGRSHRNRCALKKDKHYVKITGYDRNYYCPASNFVGWLKKEGQ